MRTRPAEARSSSAPRADYQQRVVYRPAQLQYLYHYEDDEEYDDGIGAGDLCYASPQDSQPLVRRSAQPKSASFRVLNTNTDVPSHLRSPPLLPSASPSLVQGFVLCYS
jgi:hypothetical protein